MEKQLKIHEISQCFRLLPDEEISFLEDHKTLVSYLKGETVFKQDAFAPHILFVAEGLVLAYIQFENGKKINVRLNKKGDFLAFSSVFNKNTYQFSTNAVKDSTLCMIEKEALRTVILRNPEFAMEITAKNNLNESRYIDIIKNVTYKQMRGKLASAILYLSSEELKNERVFTFLSRQDIADFASITVESAVKFLKEFEKEKLISLNGKDIIVNNRDELKSLCLKS